MGMGVAEALLRERLPDIPLLLGCARPVGRAKSEIDAYAVMAGLNGIAHPADGMVELAARRGQHRLQVGRAVQSGDPARLQLRIHPARQLDLVAGDG